MHPPLAIYDLSQWQLLGFIGFVPWVGIVGRGLSCDYGLQQVLGLGFITSVGIKDHGFGLGLGH